MSPTSALQRFFLTVHQTIYQGSRGWLGHRMVGVPTLLLRTVGARTAQRRTSALVYARDGDGYVVVASNSGADRAPGWLHNVRAHPDVELQIGRRAVAARARELRAGDADYDRLWALVNERNHGRYDRYQARTSRPIPLVVLTPAGG